MSERTFKQGTPRTRLSALRYASTILEALDTPVSLGVYLRLKHEEDLQLAELSIDPQNYVDSFDFQLDYQAVSLLLKFPKLKTGLDTEAIGRRKFQEAEERCRVTNELFRNPQSPVLQGTVASVIYRAQRKIVDILGTVPRLDALDFRFGPGASYGVRGETSAYNKILADPECSPDFVHFVGAFMAEFPGWFPDENHNVRVVPGSELTFVPKNAKTDRAICIEPTLNGLMQHGIGSYIRNRLKRHGIDLRDQSVNQGLAALAIDRQLATVDFRAASDTISYGVVLELLPVEWVQFLDICRCSSYTEDKGITWKQFHKFSSMGNAYTFELESLIFYALAWASIEEEGYKPITGWNLSVYRDDVIIPRSAYDLFSWVTGVCGFAINEDKTFREGLFFESCGHDYFDGRLVRPFFLRKDLTLLPEAFLASNNIVRFLDRLPHKGFRSHDTTARLVQSYYDVVGQIPRRLRVLGPEGYGDGHLIAPFTTAAPKRAAHGWDAWEFKSYVARPSIIHVEDMPVSYALYCAMDSMGSQHLGVDQTPTDKGAGYSPRPKQPGYRLTTLLCFGSWPDCHNLYVPEWEAVGRTTVFLSLEVDGKVEWVKQES